MFNDNFIEILRYVPMFKGKVFIICVDGDVSEEVDWQNLCADLAVLHSLSIKVVLCFDVMLRQAITKDSRFTEGEFFIDYNQVFAEKGVSQENLEIPVEGKQSEDGIVFDHRKFNVEKAADEYERRFGNEVNTDNTKQLFNAYVKNPQENIDVIRGASIATTEEVIKRNFSQPKETGKVIITAGGNGSGKTSVLGGLTEIKEQSDIVIDETLRDKNFVERLFKNTQDSGRTARLVYVYRPFEKAWRDGVIKRYKDAREAGNFRDQRVLSVKKVAEAHVKALDNFIELNDEYKQNPDFEFIANDNSKNLEELKQISVDNLRKLSYTNTDGNKIRQAERTNDSQSQVQRGQSGRSDSQTQSTQSKRSRAEAIGELVEIGRREIEKQVSEGELSQAEADLFLDEDRQAEKQSQVQSSLKNKQSENPSNYLKPIDEKFLNLLKNSAGEILNKIFLALKEFSITATSGNFITANKLGLYKGEEMGLVGKIDKADSEKISHLLDGNLLPVISPFGYSKTGRTLHLNIDSLSSFLAQKINAIKIINLGKYNIWQKITEKSQLNVRELDMLLHREYVNRPINKAFRHKLEQSLRACQQGLKRVHFVNFSGSILNELFSNKGIGYMVHSDMYQQIRHARTEDVGAIFRLIEQAMADDELQARSPEQIKQEIKDFYVLEIDSNIVGCVALHLYGKKAELACLRINSNLANYGYGSELIAFAESTAREKNCKEIFALSTQAVDFFKSKNNFEITDINYLPNERKKIAQESKRNAIILHKKL